MTDDIADRVGERVGSFRYFRADERWEWSDEATRMHGYVPGQVLPTTALVMSHKHRDDASSVALLIGAGGRPGPAVQQQAPHHRHPRRDAPSAGGR